MSDLDYFKGQWEEFRKWEEKEHGEIRKELANLGEKVDSLRLWRATVLGIASIVSGVVSFLISILGG